MTCIIVSDSGQCYTRDVPARVVWIRVNVVGAKGEQ